MIIIGAVIVILLGGIYLMAEKNIHVKKEFVINENINAVWEVMGTQYTKVHLWSTNFKNSKAGGNPKLPGINYLHHCADSLLPSRRIIVYIRDNDSSKIGPVAGI